MISNNNHIDNWLQQSAAMGNPPFENADWIAMKELLEKKRKKRLLILWLFAGMLLLGLLFFLLWMNHNGDTHTQNTIANSTQNAVIAKESVLEQIDTVKQGSIVSSDTVKSASNTLAQNNKQELPETLAANLIHQNTFNPNFAIELSSKTYWQFGIFNKCEKTIIPLPSF
jgi:cytoskeletal protein RodZ